MEPQTDSIVILDYGSQYTQLIARRARELGVFSIILPFSSTVEEIKAHQPKGVILSGGPNSVYAKNAPKLPKDLMKMEVPILGICYGLQLLAQYFGGLVEASKSREYGLAKLEQLKSSRLLSGVPKLSEVWMSHGDHVTKIPKGFIQTARSGKLVCALESEAGAIYGLQFHPEVTHSQNGQKIIKNFIKLCGVSANWTPKSFARNKIEEIKAQVGDKRVICALSGGVDSSVAATLVDASSDNVSMVTIDGSEYWLVSGLSGTGGISLAAATTGSSGSSSSNNLSTTGSKAITPVALGGLLILLVTAAGLLTRMQHQTYRR